MKPISELLVLISNKKIEFPSPKTMNPSLKGELKGPLKRSSQNMIWQGSNKI